MNILRYIKVELRIIEVATVYELSEWVLFGLQSQLVGENGLCAAENERKSGERCNRNRLDRDAGFRIHDGHSFDEYNRRNLCAVGRPQQLRRRKSHHLSCALCCVFAPSDMDSVLLRKNRPRAEN